MSMNSKLSRQRSLESLRKEAKRWFDALRRNVPDAHTRFERVVPKAPAKLTLRDVQHALALEHGFSGWAELKHKLTTGAEDCRIGIPSSVSLWTDAPGVTNTGLVHLARLPRLRELRVSGPQITAEIVSALPSQVRVYYSV